MSDERAINPAGTGARTRLRRARLGVYVYLCERCGQPLDGPHDLCNSALHVGTDGFGVGRAIRSTDLARLAGAARAGLGGWR